MKKQKSSNANAASNHHSMALRSSSRNSRMSIINGGHASAALRSTIMATSPSGDLSRSQIAGKGKQTQGKGSKSPRPQTTQKPVISNPNLEPVAGFNSLPLKLD